MKFLADGMLGKLSRWLRILGHDVKYSNALEDRELLVIAKKERRILLTKDLELCQRFAAKGLEAFSVTGVTKDEKLAELSEMFGISMVIDMNNSRCPKCNMKLRAVLREKVADLVSENTFAHYCDFWRCSGCGQVYWQGAHWDRIESTLKAAEEKVKKSMSSLSF